MYSIITVRTFRIQIFFKIAFSISLHIQRSGKIDSGFERLTSALPQAVQVLLAEFMVWLRHYLKWKVKKNHGIKKQNKKLEGFSGNITATSPWGNSGSGAFTSIEAGSLHSYATGGSEMTGWDWIFTTSFSSSQWAQIVTYTCKRGKKAHELAYYHTRIRPPLCVEST